MNEHTGFMDEINMDLFIFGEPVHTPIGNCHFLTVKEYFDYSAHLSIIAQDKNRILYVLSNQKHLEDIKTIVASLKKETFFAVVKTIQIYDQMYEKLFAHIFRDADAWSRVNEENFEELRTLIMAMNYIPQEETSSNPEIQRRLDKDTAMKSQGASIQITDVISSVVASTNTDFYQIKDYTYFQLQTLFKRVSKLKDHELTALFATVAPDVDVIDWRDHIPIQLKEEIGVERNKFDREYGGMFDNK